ncbi:hypothetical protein SAMN05216296_3002 [Pseudomonas pohangensis]|uniref:Nuclear transport factor 2 family protein n=1 Tax=Pseudomonas pohangensis TaxID=364197 RepID=A0A1H2HGX1_9PSED|nr:hypothetical protein [Pseudomonas pohangensis]SDU31141.1 hypothetical protein SAMN05216296_3002 [Pseudomonas pohangensis]
MPLRHLVLFCLLAFNGVAGCSKDSPQAALEKAVSLLQENLQEKRSSAVLEQLHPQFMAEQQYDRNWAKRTMALLYLRHKQVQVLALGKRSQIDPVYRDKGHTRAEVMLAGAQGLLPDSARQFSVDLEWWLEDGEWRLARIDWE